MERIPVQVLIRVGRVRHLNLVIKTNTLDAVKSHIILDALLRLDFTWCVTLYKDFSKQSVIMVNVQLGIAALNVAGTYKKKDRWYTHNK